jgi:hypothetical protein
MMRSRLKVRNGKQGGKQTLSGYGRSAASSVARCTLPCLKPVFKLGPLCSSEHHTDCGRQKEQAQSNRLWQTYAGRAKHVLSHNEPQCRAREANLNPD